jgi:hypothetical protein
LKRSLGTKISISVEKILREKRIASIDPPLVRRFILWIFLCGCWIAASTTVLQAEGLAPSKSRFYFKNSAGVVKSATIIRYYRSVPIVHPFAKVDPRLDPKLRRAASIADERANARSKARCWRSVKEALVSAGAITSYPKTHYAYQAGEELVRNYGFKRLSVRDPYAAPLGAVLVYGHRSSGAGHVEIRTKRGFVSDYRTKNRCRYPLLAVYGKFSS